MVLDFKCDPYNISPNAFSVGTWLVRPLLLNKYKIHYTILAFSGEKWRQYFSKRRRRGRFKMRSCPTFCSANFLPMHVFLLFISIFAISIETSFVMSLAVYLRSSFHAADVFSSCRHDVWTCIETFSSLMDTKKYVLGSIGLYCFP